MNPTCTQKCHQLSLWSCPVRSGPVITVGLRQIDCFFVNKKITCLKTFSLLLRSGFLTHNPEQKTRSVQWSAPRSAPPIPRGRLNPIGGSKHSGPAYQHLQEVDPSEKETEAQKGWEFTKFVFLSVLSLSSSLICVVRCWWLKMAATANSPAIKFTNNYLESRLLAKYLNNDGTDFTKAFRKQTQNIFTILIFDVYLSQDGRHS